jgi:hypothetical protein
MNRGTINIVKIPLPLEEKIIDIKESFPTQPIMYLELIENKSKILSNLEDSAYLFFIPKDLRTILFSIKSLF